MSSSPPLPPKKEVALALLSNSSVFVHLDPRVDGVVVPLWFKKQPQLVLQIGLNMPVPIPDLHLDEEGLSCTLSFNRSPFHCMVPWAAVYAMVDDEHRAMVWPDDVPPEVQQHVRAKAAEPEKPAPPAAVGARREKEKKSSRIADVPRGAKSKKPKLSAVPSPKKSEPEAGAARKPDAPSAPAAAAPKAPAAAPSRPSRPGAPAAPGAPTSSGASSGAGAPAGASGGARKGKRELPPYLRVVK